MRDCIKVGLRRASLVLLLTASPVALGAQAVDSVPRLSTNYWKKFAFGFGSSILAHEAGHIIASLAVGGHPSFGFDDLRPTVYSGISIYTKPHEQFLFSISGLVVQTLLDETLLDVPHSHASAFERGLLAGGIGTTAFYLTIGRRGSVSDVEFISRTGAMTKTQVTLLFGSIAAMHTIRIVKTPRYANFFARPKPEGGLELGVDWRVH